MISARGQAIRYLLTRCPDIARTVLAAVGSVTAVLVMNVSTFTCIGVTRRLRQLRRLARQEATSTDIQLGLVTASTRLDADGVIRVGDMVELHRATGQLHCRLDAPALPPRKQIELHGRASSVSRD
jgi:hypothetical protein